MSYYSFYRPTEGRRLSRPCHRVLPRAHAGACLPVAVSHLAVAEPALRLDVRDDVQSTEIDLQILDILSSSSISRHCLRRTPRPATRLQPNPAARIMQFPFIRSYLYTHYENARKAT